MTDNQHHSGCDNGRPPCAVCRNMQDGSPSRELERERSRHARVAAELATLKRQHKQLRAAAKDAVEMYDRYCLHDMSIDEYDLGKRLEVVRAALDATQAEPRYERNEGGGMP